MTTETHRSTIVRTYVIIGAKGLDCGRQIRSATADEQALYLAQSARHAAFRKPVRAGDILIDEVVSGISQIDPTAPLCW